METRDMLRMANQIADFFRSYPREEARKEVATHLTISGTRACANTCSSIWPRAAKDWTR